MYWNFPGSSATYKLKKPPVIKELRQTPTLSSQNQNHKAKVRLKTPSIPNYQALSATSLSSTSRSSFSLACIVPLVCQTPV